MKSRTYDARGELVNTVNYLGTAAAPPCEIHRAQRHRELLRTSRWKPRRHRRQGGQHHLREVRRPGPQDQGGRSRPRDVALYLGWVGQAAHADGRAGHFARVPVRRHRSSREALHQGPESSDAWVLNANWQYDLNGKPGTVSAMLGADDWRCSAAAGRAGVPRGLRVRLAFAADQPEDQRRGRRHLGESAASRSSPPGTATSAGSRE